NNAGRTGSSSFTVVDDTAAPTGGALAVNGTTATGATPVSYASGSFDVDTLTLYSEAQDATHSGLVSSSLVRTQASYTGPATCGAFGSATTTVPSTARSVAAHNRAGLSTSSNYSVVADTNAPAGGALAVNGTSATGAGSTSYSTNGTFDVGALTQYTEAQSATESGLASS